MALSRFKFALRVRHPSSRAEEIHAILNLTPSTAWSKGDQALGLDGRLLNRIRDLTYCSYELRSSRAIAPERALAAVLGTLSKKRAGLNSIVETGGTLELLIGVFCNVNCAFIMRPEQLQRLADLEIELSLDIYA